MKNKFVHAFMDCAVTFSQLSTAEKLKVGSIIVKDERIISIGYNGTPSGWSSNVCEDTKGNTLPEVIHAEMNCISKLAKSVESGAGATMFVTHSPCMECAKAIYGAGITTVIYKHLYKSSAGIEFLKKCGVEVIAQ